jgi:oxygen-independent coproporphyrinogen-3 oxidase
MAKRTQQHGYDAPLRDPMRRGELWAWFGWSPQRLAAADLLAAWKAALARRGQPGSPRTVQLYMHFALCQASCAFCQYFHVVPRERDLMRRYADYLVAVLDRSRDHLGRVEVSNGYFGGGTPSALPAPELERVVDAFVAAFRVHHEFTCEGHPANLDEPKIALLARAGVNRLSMGLQSLDPAVLRRIARVNPPLPRVGELVACARAHGMWVNTDLVLGLPGQTPESFLADLDRVLSTCRPDCLTVYRYQPVPHLAAAPSEAMRYSRVLTRPVLRRALRKGYLPATSGGDDRAGKDFLRASRRLWRQSAHRLRYEVVKLLRGDTELRQYALFEDNDSHVMGLGPGAMSHLYGHSWYRDVTAVASISGATEPVYLGTRLRPEDECGTALRRAFTAGRRIDVRALARRSGVDVAARYGDALEQARRCGALHKTGAWYRCAPDVSPQSRPELFDAFLPAAPSDPRQAIEVLALRDDPAVQSQLVAIADDVLDRAGATEDPQPGADDVLGDWAALIGLGAPGQTFAEALIDRVVGGAVEFRVVPAPAPPLRVVVERAAGQPSFTTAGPYAISYTARPGHALDPREQRFLLELAARTTAALTAGGAARPVVPPAAPAAD